MSEILEQFNSVGKKALSELRQVRSMEELEAFRIRYFSRKGEITCLLGQLGELPKEIKPQAGQLANKIKNEVKAAFDARQNSLQQDHKSVAGQEFFDVTIPGEPVRLGSAHPITQTIDELLEIFGRMGFEIGYGPEIEDEYHNFIALNIDESHPARDPMDNFYINEHTLLRPMTSTIQIREMERRKPPIRLVAPGRVYRPDAVDATHMYMFHQIEALVVDEGISMVDLKSTMDQFIQGYFGVGTQWRFRPSFFPFTEPSGEVDMLLTGKDGSGRWVEMGGCGMVDPNVFDAVGYDAEKYTGWAFGFGIERLVMRKYGITDIRLLYENDLRFLKQF
jgi:phenylalanyl-tRNA synthetase alpha chain